MSTLSRSSLALNNAKSSENLTLSTPQYKTGKQERRRDRDFTVSWQVVKLGFVRKYSCSVYYHCQTLFCSLLDVVRHFKEAFVYILIYFCDIVIFCCDERIQNPFFRCSIPSKIVNHTFTTNYLMLSYHPLPK